jgi:DNA recombination protein RmuC
MVTYILVAAVLGVLLGALFGSLIGMATTGAARKSAENLQAELEKRNTEIESLRTQLAEAQERAVRAEEEAKRVSELKLTLEAAEQSRDQFRHELSAAQNENTRLTTNLANEERNVQEKIQLLQESREELKNQFQTLAQDILEQKSKVFAEQNQSSIGNLLNPIREKFTEFQQKVTELREQGIEHRAELKTQIENLSNLNERLSAEANSLVKALKGSSKTQGDWGELLLEQILESAGLRKGEQFQVQQTHSGEQDGETRKFRPDVILNLPEGKHLVVDSKVSLRDYSDYSAASDDAERDTALKQHLNAVQNHIRDLSTRKYQNLYDLQSVDFVIMFVPIEPAYIVALAHDSNLWQKAWEQNVLLVGPSTLLFVVRTVAELWRQEQQNRNAQTIADRGAELYDKLSAFVKDLEDTGRNIDRAKASYDEAYKKLATGRGNAIRQAEMLRDLGVKSTKQLPSQLVEMAHHEPLELAAVGDEDSEEE